MARVEETRFLQAPGEFLERCGRQPGVEFRLRQDPDRVERVSAVELFEDEGLDRPEAKEPAAARVLDHADRRAVPFLLADEQVRTTFGRGLSHGQSTD